MEDVPSRTVAEAVEEINGAADILLEEMFVTQRVEDLITDHETMDSE